MPYIVKEKRERFESVVSNLVAYLQEDIENVAGNLNYMITAVLKRLIATNKKYKTMNDLIGVLECCKLELYRRVISPYEDTAIERNGDVE
jgi:hypothetical protein